MNDDERNEMLAIIAAYKEKLAGNKEESRKFLIGLGIYNPDGTLTENYKNFRI